jgi:hypothetical protein
MAVGTSRGKVSIHNCHPIIPDLILHPLTRLWSVISVHPRPLLRHCPQYQRDQHGVQAQGGQAAGGSGHECGQEQAKSVETQVHPLTQDCAERYQGKHRGRQTDAGDRRSGEGSFCQG